MKITKEVLSALIDHARLEIPNEACGYLAAENNTIVHAIPMTNLDRAADHFTMDPAEQFAAVKLIRAKGLRLAAVYHSHPATPARPSAEDIRLAHDPELSYVILSLAGATPEIKSFKIRSGTVSPEKLEVVANGGQPGFQIDAVKNYRGLGCPMNLVYTKVELATLQPGQVLEVLLDDGPPINNVPASVCREGHKILTRRQLDDGSWSVLLEKA